MGILHNELQLVINPEAARILGLNEAIVLQQLHYWISKNTNIRDGRSWVYNTMQEWQEQFSFWSVSTIRRTLESLQASGIVLTGNYNERKFDKTLWYTIDYDALDAIVKIRKSICSKWTNGTAQNEQKDVPKLSKPIPKTTIDYTKTNIKKESKSRPISEKSYDELVSEYTDNIDLQKAVYEYIKMRKLIKRPLTNRALELALKNLSGLGADDNERIAILNQSIASSWMGLFPLKGKDRQAAPSNTDSFASAIEQAKEMVKNANSR